MHFTSVCQVYIPNKTTNRRFEPNNDHFIQNLLELKLFVNHDLLNQTITLVQQHIHNIRPLEFEDRVFRLDCTLELVDFSIQFDAWLAHFDANERHLLHEKITLITNYIILRDFQRILKGYADAIYFAHIQDFRGRVYPASRISYTRDLMFRFF